MKSAFVISLIYRVSRTLTGRLNYEEQLVYLEAPSKELAILEASSLGEKENEVLETIDDGFVVWNFLGIRFAVPIDDYKNGSPFISRNIKSTEIDHMVFLKSQEEFDELLVV